MGHADLREVSLKDVGITSCHIRSQISVKFKSIDSKDPLPIDLSRKSSCSKYWAFSKTETFTSNLRVIRSSVH